MNDIEDKLLTPFYLKVLHGNLVTQVPGREQEVILGQMSAVARTVTFEDVAYLWTRGWRASAGESIPDRLGQHGVCGAATRIAVTMLQHM